MSGFPGPSDFMLAFPENDRDLVPSNLAFQDTCGADGQSDHLWSLNHSSNAPEETTQLQLAPPPAHINYVPCWPHIPVERPETLGGTSSAANIPLSSNLNKVHAFSPYHVTSQTGTVPAISPGGGTNPLREVNCHPPSSSTSFLPVQPESHINSPDAPIVHTCEWISNDGSICGSQITKGTLPKHLATHGIEKMAYDHPVTCCWKGCLKTITRKNLARHIWEIDLRNPRKI